MRFLRTRSFFIRYREGITFGVLAGVLISNLYLGVIANRTANQVLEISQQIKDSAVTNENLSEQARNESERRYNVLVEYINCLLKASVIHSSESQEGCFVKAKQNIPAEREGLAPIPQTSNQPNAPRQSPTTSEPPEPPSTENSGLVQRLNDVVENSLSTVDNLIGGVLAR
jgi:hypothetical protein